MLERRAPLLAALALAACGAPAPAPARETTTEAVAAPAPEEAEVGASEPAPVQAPPPPRLAVTEQPRSPLEGRPRVRLLAPTDQQVVRRGPVTVRLELRDWPLHPPPGAHVHLSVDGGREMAISDASSPIDLNALYERAHGEPLPAGSHVLRAFLGRADHESVKTDDAYAEVVFHHRERTSGFQLDRRAPRLLYSRPQGCSSSRARLLDFYLRNVPALSADGTRVRYVIDEELEGVATAWTPHRISGLSQGQHRARIALVDASGEVVPGSETARTFRVDDDCPTYAVQEYAPTEAEDDDDDQGM